ncbi:MAG: recombinase family protein [Chitinophagaceae bacterium]|nr:recombinase family protein [Chitinophagaceae bacterium]
MINNLSNEVLPNEFAKQHKVLSARQTKTCVIYTRVSSKEQEDNSSLASQKRHCEDFCIRKGIQIAQYFGGTYESAQKDERKEFKKMLDYVKKDRKIDSIVVYSFDRFSRSGANAIYLTNELYKIGISLLAVSQERTPQHQQASFKKIFFFCSASLIMTYGGIKR